MNKNVKMFSLAVMLLIALLSLATFVSADSDFYDIEKVEVDGVELDPLTPAVLQVELDDTVEVEVTVLGADFDVVCDETTGTDPEHENCNGVDDARVEVSIHGYEYGDLDDVSDIFDIEDGVSYKKTLNIELPDDLEVEDDNFYTLHVEVYDDNDRETFSADIELFIERPRHSVKLVDTIFASSVDAGNYLYFEARVENLGDSNEDDIKVEVDIAGVANTATYIDELAAFEEDNEDDESSDSANLNLYISEDTLSGYYDVTVTVTYDRGHEELVQVESVWIDGVDAEVVDPATEQTPAEVTVSLSSTDLVGSSDEASTFTLNFANAGDLSETYVVAVSGVAQWATSSIEPSVVIVNGGSSEEISVTVTPDSDAEGEYEFTVQILDSSSEVVQEVSMSMNVEKTSTAVTGSSALKIVFIVLIVLIILIGLVVAFRRLGDDEDEDPLEPKDGQAYY
jgi:hypothetical protein